MKKLSKDIGSRFMLFCWTLLWCVLLFLKLLWCHAIFFLKAFGGKTIILDDERLEHRISLDELAPTKLVTLPRPYPSFLPYYFDRAGVVPFDVSKVDTL